MQKKESPDFRLPEVGISGITKAFLRGLFLEWLIFGGAYVRREICVSKSIGLALWLEVNLPFLLCFTLYLRASCKYKSPGEGGGGGIYLEGRFDGGFLSLRVWRGLFPKFYGNCRKVIPLRRSH